MAGVTTGIIAVSVEPGTEVEGFQFAAVFQSVEIVPVQVRRLQALTETAKDEAEVAPQAVLAVTEIVPPLLPGVTVMLLVVLVPVHPEGNVQV